MTAATMRRLLVALAGIAGILLPVVPAFTAEAAAQPFERDSGIGVRLVDVPTATAQDPRARAYIIDHVRPGTTIERRIEVVNHGRDEAKVRIYPAAAEVTEGGFVGAAGHTQSELSSWTVATPDTLVLAGRERAFVKVKIQVPTTAVRGESYGVVWAEIATKPQKEGGVTQVGRVGIRLYLSIGPGGAPRTDFKIESITGIRNDKSVPMVQATVRNTGERALDLTGALTLAEGPAGLSAGPFPVPLGTTLALGQTAPVLVPLDPRLPDGPWLVKVKVSSGTTERTAEATITFPSGPGVGPVVPTGGISMLLGWGAAAAAALLLLVLVVLLQRRRNRREKVPVDA